MICELDQVFLEKDNYFLRTWGLDFKYEFSIHDTLLPKPWTLNDGRKWFERESDVTKLAAMA